MSYKIKLLIILVIFIKSVVVYATTSIVQVNVEGNATCSSLATNAVIQAKDTSVTVNGTDSVTGPAPDSQVFQYSTRSSTGLSNNVIESWSITPPASGTIKPVNYVIVKKIGSNGATAFYYDHSGAVNDTDIVLTASIQAVSFCYGLPTASPSSTLEPCANDPNFNIDICNLPGDVQARIITTFDEPNNSTENWKVKTCACGNFTECNPNLLSGTPGSCTKKPSGPDPKGLLYLPTSTELARDPGTYYCLLFNGIRKCYSK